MKKSYRPNVAAILQLPDGRVLIGQRADHPESWQFPQGGIDAGESPEEAVGREILEEVSLHPGTYRITDSSGPYRYDFPTGRDKRGFSGQEQYYFICSLQGGEPPAIDFAATCGEFTAVRWVPVAEFPVDLAPPMKQAVYHEVLRRHFGSDANSR